jgi:chromosome partitioning protein
MFKNLLRMNVLISMPNPRVIVVTNQKGGAGKTTVVALLGYGLAAFRNRRVLLMDMDPQSHLSSFFLPVNELLEVKDGIREFLNRGLEAAKIRTIRFKGSKAELYLLPSGVNYIVESIKGLMPFLDNFALYRQLNKYAHQLSVFDYIICDTPPEMFAPTQWALYAADYILIPISMEELSIIGAKITIRDVLPYIFEASKKSPWLLGVILNNITRKFKQETIDELERSFERLIKNISAKLIEINDRIYSKRILFNTIIYRNRGLSRLSYTPRKWEMPIDKIINKYSTLKSSTESLAKEVEERINEIEEIQKEKEYSLKIINKREKSLG